MVTKRKLMEAFRIPEPQAKELARMIRRSVDSGSENYLRRKFPGERFVTSDEVLDRANEVLDGFGVEPINCEYCRVDRYYYDIVLLYVNMGDTYSTTLLYDTKREEFMIGSWGGWLEEHEAEEHPPEEEEGETEDDYPPHEEGTSVKDWRPPEG